MFNKDFYPTPSTVLEQMQIDCSGKIVYEPSAGSGNIIQFLRNNGAASIIASELNDDLAQIAKSKADKFIPGSFLDVKPEQISHIDMIVMNPPFSNGDAHVLHAWQIAPDGCEIKSLINAETLTNAYSRQRRELNNIVSNYGQVINFDNAFSDAERKTDVSVAMITLFKPKSSSEAEWEGFFLDEEPEAQANGIMKFDAVRDIVNRYVAAVKCFDEHLIIAQRMSALTLDFNVGTFSFGISHNNAVVSRDEFKKELQKKAWASIFDKVNLNKFVTSGVMKDINKFVENQTKVPFTMKNVYHMFDIIVGTSPEIFNRSLVEALDNFTMHTHENRYEVEGWKTNDAHMLNSKFIIGYLFQMGYNGYLTWNYSSRNVERLEDLVKVLCWVTGTDYQSIQAFHVFANQTKIVANTWYDWGFFRVKAFKKGTGHFQFKDLDHWAMLNERYAKIKGLAIPETIRIRKRKTQTA